MRVILFVFLRVKLVGMSKIKSCCGYVGWLLLELLIKCLNNGSMPSLLDLFWNLGLLVHPATLLEQSGFLCIFIVRFFKLEI